MSIENIAPRDQIESFPASDEFGLFNR